MIKIFSLTVFLTLALSNLCIAENAEIFQGVPTNYSECTKTEQKYKTVSILKCDYSISTDKTNTPETEKFLQCLSKYPEYKELAELPCQYVSNEGNAVVPKILKCLKDDRTPYYPGVIDDRPCTLRFYNPDYIFPKNFQECKLQGGEMSQTYTGEETCRIIVELCGEDKATYCTEVYNKKESEALLNKCKELGGQFEKSLGRFPECALSFIDQ